MTKYLSFLKSFILVALMFFLVGCGETKYTLTLNANGGELNGQEIVTIT